MAGGCAASSLRAFSLAAACSSIWSARTTALQTGVARIRAFMPCRWARPHQLPHRVPGMRAAAQAADQVDPAVRAPEQPGASPCGPAPARLRTTRSRSKHRTAFSSERATASCAERSTIWPTPSVSSACRAIRAASSSESKGRCPPRRPRLLTHCRGGARPAGEPVGQGRPLPSARARGHPNPGGAGGEGPRASPAAGCRHQRRLRGRGCRDAAPHHHEPRRQGRQPPGSHSLGCPHLA